jgi:Na+/H+ antiporter NhaC
MSQLLLFVMATCGFTYIMTDSNIMEPVRDWLEKQIPPKAFEVFTCHQCMGFWTGLICGWTLLGGTFAAAIMGGFASSFVSLFFGRVATALRELADCLLHASLYYESQTVINLEDNE